MDTELYSIIMDKIYSSGLSKRNFCEKYHIPRGWLIEFTNPTKTFRIIHTDTIGMLKNNLGIDPKICEAYNNEIYKGRQELEKLKKESDL